MALLEFKDINKFEIYKIILIKYLQKLTFLKLN